jgi:hypothetical protein
MKLHHIGIVCSESDINKFIFSTKRKHIYYDKIQKNKIFIGFNNHNNLWYEFIVPISKQSTVINFFKKNGPSIHHFAYHVNDFEKTIKDYKKRRNYTFIREFKTNIPCFGGNLRTAFFFNNNIFIEFLKNEKPSKK